VANPSERLAKTGLKSLETKERKMDMRDESGFEPLVPLATEMLIELARGITNATRMLAVGDIGLVPWLC
jgi:hypothetical protein